MSYENSSGGRHSERRPGRREQPERRQETRPAATGRTRKRKGAFGCLGAATYLLFILGVAIVLSTFIILVSNDVFALTKESEQVTVTIEENMSRGDVSHLLKDQGVIKYPTFFTLFQKLKKVDDGSIKAGDYVVDAALDYNAIINVLKSTQNKKEIVALTIPEGYTTEQIVELMVEKKVCDEESLWDAVENYDFDYDCMEYAGEGRRRLEGLLFPDTYEFYVGDSAPNVFGRMLKNFDAKFTDAMKGLADDRGKSVRDILIIASLIEREAKLAAEQETVAGVIYNRLNSSSYPYLEIDATVQYIVGHKGEELTRADLEIDDPYNTYKYKGLPPGLIANPGLGAITAALNPEDHGYYFYVARADGSHIFSKTLDEHNVAVAKVQAENNG